MKRSQVIERLILEGFTERTLSRLTDRELSVLSERIITTADALSKNPQLKAMADDPNIAIEVREDEECEKCANCDMCKDECTCDHSKDEVESWVLNLAESKFSNFTSKKDILGIITEKVKEAAIPMPATKATKGHNGVPEFMTFDAIMGNQPSPNPSQPEVIPDTPPTEKPTKPKTPYRPGPGTNPKPKALAEKK